MTADRIHIEVERSGGFAGTVQRGALDSSKLGAKEAREVADLLDRSGLEALGGKAPGRAGVDRFQYHVVVERGDDRTELVLGETEVPDELRALLDRVVSGR